MQQMQYISCRGMSSAGVLILWYQKLVGDNLGCSAGQVCGDGHGHMGDCVVPVAHAHLEVSADWLLQGCSCICAAWIKLLTIVSSLSHRFFCSFCHLGCGCLEDLFKRKSLSSLHVIMIQRRFSMTFKKPSMLP